MKKAFAVLWRLGLLALTLALLLKWGVVDGYEIRGNSMNPLLRDRVGSPDKIAVFKPHYRLFEPERYELVVFERPEVEADAALPPDLGGDLFVKRIVGLPGDQVWLEGGDLHLRRAAGRAAPGPPEGEREAHEVPEKQEGQDELDRGEGPAQRPLPVLLSMQQRVHRYEPAERGRGPWRLPAAAEDLPDGFALDVGGREGDAGGAAEGEVLYEDWVYDDWVDEQGVRRRGGDVVNDTGLAFSLELARPGSKLRAVLQEEGDRFELHLSDGAEARLVRHRGPAGEEVAVERLGASRLQVGRPAEVCFLNVDDTIYLLLDGTLVLRHRYPGNTRVLGPPNNAPSLELERGAARVRRLEVLRDVFYTDGDGSFGVRGAAYTVPDGQYFTLGDNSVNSRDSRHFGAIPRSRFGGRPFLIVHPFGRLRLL